MHYFDPRIENMPAFAGFGDTCGIVDLMARKGARGYMFFDSKFEDCIFPRDGMPMALGCYGERCPMNCGILGKCLTGLLVDPEMRVVRERNVTSVPLWDSRQSRFLKLMRDFSTI